MWRVHKPWGEQQPRRTRVRERRPGREREKDTSIRTTTRCACTRSQAARLTLKCVASGVLVPLFSILVTLRSPCSHITTSPDPGACTKKIPGRHKKSATFGRLSKRPRDQQRCGLSNLGRIDSSFPITSCCNPPSSIPPFLVPPPPLFVGPVFGVSSTGLVHPHGE